MRKSFVICDWGMVIWGLDKPLWKSHKCMSQFSWNMIQCNEISFVWTRIQCFQCRSTCRSASGKRRARPCAVYISKECITDLNALPKFHFIMKWNKRFYTQEKKKERDFLLENRSVKLNETAPKIFISLSLIFKFHLYIQHNTWAQGLFKSSITDTNKTRSLKGFTWQI